jgi:hypothetical protein
MLDDQELVYGWTIRDLSLRDDQDFGWKNRDSCVAVRTGTLLWLDDQGFF